MPEIIDPVFMKTSPKRSFSLIENERFSLGFAKTGAMNSGKGQNHKEFLLYEEMYKQLHTYEKSFLTYEFLQ